MHDLIVIPGLGSDGAVWSRTTALLAQEARCTVGDTLHDASLAGMAQTILRDAPERFFLAGLSMGGMVALEIMRVAAGRVQGLAIIGSNGFPDTPQEAEQRRQGLAAIRAGVDLQRAGEASLGRLVHSAAPDDVRAEIVAMGIRVGSATYARQIEAVLHRDDQQPVLQGIRIPTIFVTGEDDRMIPQGRAGDMAAMVSQSGLIVIPDCGHLPPIEQPQATAEAIRRLIATA